MAQINLGTVPLSDRDHDYIRAMSTVCGWSVRSKMSVILEDFVRANLAEFRDVIEYSARKHGLSFEEAFDRLRRGEGLGEPLDHFPVDSAMEEKLNGLAQT